MYFRRWFCFCLEVRLAGGQNLTLLGPLAKLVSTLGCDNQALDFDDMSSFFWYVPDNVRKTLFMIPWIQKCIFYRSFSVILEF
jgi:hypothetical protein